MRDVVEASLAVIRNRWRAVLAVVLVLWLPSTAILVLAPSGSAVGLAGTLLVLVTDLALVALFLDQTGQKPLASNTPVSLVRAGVKVVAALGVGIAFLVVVAALAFIVLLVLLVVAMNASPPFADYVECVSLGNVPAWAPTVVAALSFAALAPFLLITPISLVENGGPWWTLKRAWRLSRPERTWMWILLGSLALGAAVLQVTFSTGALTLVTYAASAVSFVVEEALLAVFYTRLVVLVPVPVSVSGRLADAIARPRTQAAAAGTFRQSNRPRKAKKRRR
jgi:hypothetical protein